MSRLKQAPVSGALAKAINPKTNCLTRRVTNRLDMSRLEAGALGPQIEWASIVVADVLDRMEPNLAGRFVDTDFPDGAADSRRWISRRSATY